MKIIGGPYCGGYIGTEINIHPILTTTILRQLYTYDGATSVWRFKDYNWGVLNAR